MTRKNFTIVPNAADDDSRLDAYARTLYLHYCRRGECWEEDEKIARFLGISLPTLRKKRKLLIDCGYITAERRFWNTGGSRWHVVPREVEESQAEAPLGPVAMAEIDQAERNVRSNRTKRRFVGRTKPEITPNETSDQPERNVVSFATTNEQKPPKKTHTSRQVGGNEPSDEFLLALPEPPTGVLYARWFALKMRERMRESEGSGPLARAAPRRAG